MLQAIDILGAINKPCKVYVISEQTSLLIKTDFCYKKWVGNIEIFNPLFLVIGFLGIERTPSFDVFLSQSRWR